MSTRAVRFAFALLLFAPALAGLAAEKDNYGDPLPSGAAGRLGTVRLRNTAYSTPLLSPDAKTLYVAGPSGLKLLDPATGAPVGKLETQLPGSLIGFSADGKRGVQSTFDALVVWDVASGKTLAKLSGRSISDGTLALSADGKRFAIGGYANPNKKEPVKVVVWDVDANKEVTSVTAPHNQFAQAALSADGKTLAVWGGHYDPNAKPEDQDKSPARFVYFHDAATGKELSKFHGHTYTPQTVVFSPAGLAAVCYGTGTVHLVDPKTGEGKSQFLGRARMGRFVTFSPDGSVVVAAGDDGAVQTWRVADGARLATVEPPVAGIYGVRVRMLDNEKGVAWGNRNMAAFVWEVPSGKPFGPTEGHTTPATSIAVTPDGKHALTSSSGGSLRWELGTNKLLGEVTLKHPGGVPGGSATSALFSTDGSRALIRDSYNGTAVFDVATGTQWYIIPTPGSSYYSQESFSPDGSKIIAVQMSSEEKKKPARVQVLDTVSGKRLGEVELAGYSRVAATVTPDGKYLVTAGSKPAEKGAETFVTTGWELATGTKKGELTGKAQYYQPQILTAPDNKTAAVATGDGKVIAFDILEGKEVRSYDLKARGHNSQMALAPDRKRFAIVCQPNYGKNATAPVAVFEWGSGDAVQTVAVPDFAPQAIAFTPDGKKLLTSAGDTSVIVWELGK